MPGNVVNKQKVNPIRGCKCCEGLRKWRARVHSNAHSIETLDCPDICPAVNQYRKYRGLIGRQYHRDKGGDGGREGAVMNRKVATTEGITWRSISVILGRNKC